MLRRFGLDPFFDVEADGQEGAVFMEHLNSKDSIYNHDMDWVGGALTDLEKDWLSKCLATKAADRWSIVKLLHHPYLSEAS